MTKADMGTYSCTVTNAVGSVSKYVMLGTLIFTIVMSKEFACDWTI